MGIDKIWYNQLHFLIELDDDVVVVYLLLWMLLVFYFPFGFQELFEGYYFCQSQREDFFQRAKPYKGHPTILIEMMEQLVLIEMIYLLHIH